MVWVHNKINRTYKYDPKGYGTMRKNEKQTEQNRCEDKFPEWTGLGLGESLRKAQDIEE